MKTKNVATKSNKICKIISISALPILFFYRNFSGINLAAIVCTQHF